MWRTIFTLMSDAPDWTQKHNEVTKMLAEGWVIQHAQVLPNNGSVVAFYYLTKIDVSSAKAGERV